MEYRCVSCLASENDFGKLGTNATQIIIMESLTESYCSGPAPSVNFTDFVNNYPKEGGSGGVTIGPTTSAAGRSGSLKVLSNFNEVMVLLSGLLGLAVLVVVAIL